MTVVNETTGDYESEHVALWLLLGIASISDRLRAILERAPESSVCESPLSDVDHLVLGLLSVDARLRSLGGRAGAGATRPPLGQRAWNDDGARWLR